MIPSQRRPSLFLILQILTCSFLFNPAIGQYSYFKGTMNGSMTVADFDGDGFKDIFINGEENNVSNFHALIYINNGEGHFYELIPSGIDSLSLSDSDAADVDNDGDIDLMVSGSGMVNNGYEKFYTQLYLNDGDARFRKAEGLPFVHMNASTIRFADVDNDDDMDVLVAGQSPGLQTILYLNDGHGIFTISNSQPFIGVMDGDAEFIDLNNDDDLDLVVVGGAGVSHDFRSATLYMNDGTGKFSIDTVSTLEAVSEGDIDLNDFDLDGDPDLIITGMNTEQKATTKLYLNDSFGAFTESSQSLQGVYYSTATSEDIDQDGDYDLLLSGYTGSSNPHTILYLNNGDASFTQATNTNLHPMTHGNVEFLDLSNDDLPDLIMVGNSYYHGRGYYYLNMGNGVFSEVKAVSVPEFTNESDFQIYFNPESNKIIIQFNKSVISGSASLYDTNGRLIQKAQIEPYINRFTMDIENLYKGIYLIRVENSEFVETRKLYIN